MPAWTMWLIIAGFFMILEIVTVGFLVIWIGVGAIPALIYSIFFPEQTIAQIAIWVICSIILILLTKKFTDKLKPTPTPTNVYSIIGKKAVVTQEINNEKGVGQVKVGGDTWSAKTENFTEIVPENTPVEVVAIEGVKVIVKKAVEEAKTEEKSTSDK